MCTVNRSRIGETFDDAVLREIVNATVSWKSWAPILLSRLVNSFSCFHVATDTYTSYACLGQQIYMCSASHHSLSDVPIPPSFG
jgi:hypothetical protein